MLESLFLTLTLALGQTGPASSPGPAPPPSRGTLSLALDDGGPPSSATLPVESTPTLPRPVLKLDPGTITQTSLRQDAGTDTKDTKAPEPAQVNAPVLPPTPPPPTPPAPPAAPAAPPPRYFLMEALQGTWMGQALDGTRTQLTGWSEFSYTLSSVGHVDLPETLNYRGNEPMMQQTWVRLARSVVTSGTTTPTFGFQSDWIIGTDYRFTLPQKGILNDQLTDRTLYNVSTQSPTFAPNIYGVDPVQFFAEAYFPTIGRGLDVKLGRFYTPYGVESLESPNTPLISHSYIFSSGSPFTHTGILGTLTLTDAWTVQGGLVLGSDLFIHPADRATGIFTIQWTQPHGTQNATAQPFARNIVKFTTIDGPGRFDDNYGVQHINIYDLVWTHQFNPVLVSNVEALYGWERHVPDAFGSLVFPAGASPHLGFVNWGGIAGYLTYTFSPRFTGTVRLEGFDDPEGIRTISAEDPFVDRTKGLYTAATVGGQWKIRKGIYFEPELRYDYNLDSAPFGATVDHPTNGHHGMATAASALIIRW